MTSLLCLAFVAMLVPPRTARAELYLRPYGVATTVDFCLYNPTATALLTNASFAAGEVKIMLDEGNETNVTTLPTDEGNCYSQPLTAAEMSAQRIMLQYIDTPTALWLDKAIIIETTPLTVSGLGSMTSSAAVTIFNAGISGTSTDTVTTAIRLPANFRAGNLWLNADYASGAGATLAVTLQISPDNTNWHDYAVFTTVGTTDTTQRLPISTAMFRFARLKYTVTGTTPVYTNVLVEIWGEPK